MYRFLDTRVRALNIGRTQLMLPMCVLLQLMVPPPHHEFSARMVEYLQAVQGRMSEGGWGLGQGGPRAAGVGTREPGRVQEGLGMWPGGEAKLSHSGASKNWSRRSTFFIKSVPNLRAAR